MIYIDLQYVQLVMIYYNHTHGFVQFFGTSRHGHPAQTMTAPEPAPDPPGMKARSESAENRVQRNRRNRRKGRNGFNIQGPVPIVASPFPRVPGITNTSTFTRRNGSSSVITLVARNPTRGRWICRTIRRFTLR